MVEGTIGKWLKQPGDSIERYEPLVEVITDKVTMEVPSPVTGSLLRILAQEGETVPMGAAIAELETTEVPDRVTPAPAPVPAPTVSAHAGHAGVASTTGYLVTDVKPVGPTGGGSGPEGVSQPETIGTPAPGGATRPSPAVRRLAREHGVDL